MSEREELELAARAIGKRYQHLMIKKHLHDEHRHVADGVEWNPLTDDGDAFRLAVELRIRHFQGINGRFYAHHESFGKRTMIETCADPYAATRRAIVRAAAEIGRNMK